MANFVDLDFTPEGDLSLGFNGDLLVARDAEVVQQEVLFRLKTVKGDWILEPRCGADLELRIGDPNNQTTALRIRDQVEEALTHDGYLRGELLDILVVPLNPQELAIYVLLDLEGDEATIVSATLDLKQGLL